MGVFSVPIRARNWQNRFLPAARQGEEVTCNALVDTGALELALPIELIDCLKLEPIATVGVYTGDGARHQRRVFGIVELEVQGRVCHVRAIELPRGAQPLLGAVPLEQMDWRVSPQEMRLIPNPKSPDEPLLPLCRFGGGPAIGGVRPWRLMRPTMPSARPEGGSRTLRNPCRQGNLREYGMLE